MAKLQAEMRAEIDPHILAWRHTDTGEERLIIFLAPYLAHRCMNVSLAPGTCAFSGQSTWLSELDSDRASLSSKFPILSFIWETWQGSGVRRSEFEAMYLERIPALPGTWDGTLETCRLSDP